MRLLSNPLFLLWVLGVGGAVAIGVAGVRGKGVSLVGRHRVRGTAGRVIGVIALLTALALLVVPLIVLMQMERGLR